MHGCDLDPEDHALLRAAPPAQALRWAAAAVGAGAEVVRATALEGGTSSAVHALDVRTASGARERVVLRRFVREDWLEEEPDAPLHEADALRALRGAPVATPELIALDPDGARAGAPALLMTRLDGVVDWAPAELDGYLRPLAQTLVQIHATPPPAAPHHLHLYDSWAHELERPLPGSALPAAVWERAFELFARPAPRGATLLHRDFHPGNVLWRDGEVSGVVDWVSTSIGLPDADVGYCRENLAREISLDAADRFLALHRELTGAGPLDPYWDVAALLGGHDEESLAGWGARQDAFLARAIEQL